MSTSQPSTSRLALMGKHSRPSSRAFAIGSVIGGLLAIFGPATDRVPVVAITMGFALVAVAFSLLGRLASSTSPCVRS